MNKKTNLAVEGILKIRATIPTGERANARITGVDDLIFDDQGDRTIVTASRHNAFVNQGLQVMLDRAFALNGPPSAISHIGVTSDTTAVTAATTTLDDGATGNLTIVALNPAATRSTQTVTAGGPFTQANVAFAINKVGLLNAATDSTSVIDIIGGTGGVSPYDEPFAIDLTNVSEWDLQLEIDVTLTAV